MNGSFIVVVVMSSLEKEGKVEGCIKCHAAKKANDFVFTTEFVK